MLSFGKNPVSYQKWLAQSSAATTEWERAQQEAERAIERARQTAKATAATAQQSRGRSFQDFAAKYTQPTGRPWYTHEISNIEVAWAQANGLALEDAQSALSSSGLRFVDAPASEFPEGQRKASSGLGDLGLLAAVAGVVTGGLGLIGTLGELAASAGLAEVASLAAADAGFIGAAGASALSGAGTGIGFGAAAGVAKNAFGIANSVAKLTGSSAAPANPIPRSTSIGSPTMAPNASPFYLVNQDTAASAQGAAPQTPGAASARSVVAGMPDMMSPTVLVLVAAAAVAWYAFKD